MRVYRIPTKPTCPLRIQMSDDELVAAIQVRDTDDVPFYWLPVPAELAKQMIEEYQMKVAFHLPDTPRDQIF